MTKWAFIASAFLLALVPVQGARAYQFKDIYAFCQQQPCTDGQDVVSGVVSDPAGNIYGTTTDGGDIGANGARNGVVYELIPKAGHTSWTYRRLYSFCQKAACADGAQPYSTLIIDTHGNLYGTTRTAGAAEAGNVFELSPNKRHVRWRLHVLHGFCQNGIAGCTDGQHPQRSLTYLGAATGAPYDGQSPLYGTTAQGGAYAGSSGGNGTAFQLTPLSGTRWKEKVIYNFCPDSSCGTVLGSPSSALLLDASGNLYGTAEGSGPGDLFELTPNARRTKWTETTLHHFCSLDACADGNIPAAEYLFLDAAGTLYGTTLEGGNSYLGEGAGVLYKLVPNGARSAFTVLYDFCSLADCADGGIPVAGVTRDASGSLLGTTTYGGAESAGTAYSYANGSMQLLHTFCGSLDCDGSSPGASLTIDPSGIVYGTTYRHVFALVP